MPIDIETKLDEPSPDAISEGSQTTYINNAGFIKTTENPDDLMQYLHGDCCDKRNSPIQSSHIAKIYIEVLCLACGQIQSTKSEDAPLNLQKNQPFYPDLTCILCGINPSKVIKGQKEINPKVGFVRFERKSNQNNIKQKSLFSKLMGIRRK